MVEFELANGNPVLVNPDRVIFAEPVHGAVGLYALTVWCHVAVSARGELATPNTSIVVKATMGEIKSKLGGFTRGPLFSGAGGQAG